MTTAGPISPGTRAAWCGPVCSGTAAKAERASRRSASRTRTARRHGAGGSSAGTGAPYSRRSTRARYDLGGSVSTSRGARFRRHGAAAARRSGTTIVRRKSRTRSARQCLSREAPWRHHGRHNWVGGDAVERDLRPLEVPRFAYFSACPRCSARTISASRTGSRYPRARARIFTTLWNVFQSPCLGAVPRDGWTSRVSAGRGFFAPTPLTEETEAAGLSGLSLPQPLVAETGNAFRLM